MISALCGTWPLVSVEGASRAVRRCRSRSRRRKCRTNIFRLHLLDQMSSPSQGEQINNYYQALFRAWGRQQWWPARTRFEVIVGA